MEKELLGMAARWRKTEMEKLAKCKPASIAEFAKQMPLITCRRTEYNLVKFQARTAKGVKMRKTVAVIALTLALGLTTAAKTHHHHQEPKQEVTNDISDTDAWRHYLLHVAATSVGPPPDTSKLQGDLLAIATNSWKFRTEFEKAIDDFNASQETRTEADQLAALNNFIVQRDAMVEAYKNDLISALTPQTRTEFESEVQKRKDVIKSFGASGKSCGLPNNITCSITYSSLPLGGGMNADHNLYGRSSQILDGAAPMVGNSQTARHTPTVKVTINGGAEHNNSGKSVCADCYLYVNATVSFAMVGGVQYETSGEGIVVCNEAGKFFDTSATSE
jgi:hypothetical protein